MNLKRVIGIIALLIGILLLSVSFYIKGRVSEGREKIAAAQGQVEQGKKILSLTPATKEIGKGMTAGVQQKINEAKSLAAQYDTMVIWLQIGGSLFVLAGAVLVFVGRKK